MAGRARLQVQGLRGDVALKECMETGLAGRDGIRAAYANTIMGNVLIFFDPRRSLPEIVGIVRVVLEEPSLKRRTKPPAHRAPAAPWLKRLFGCASQPGPALRAGWPWHALSRAE